MKRSRLSRRIEKQTKRNLLLSTIGTLLVILVLIKFGIPFLVKFSLFLSGSKSSTTQQSENSNNTFISAPVLDSLPNATNSAIIKISGSSNKNQTIELYINDLLTGRTQTENNENFSFNGTLNPGENIIKVKAKVNNNQSDFSLSETVVLKSAAPSLNLKSPTDGQSFSKDQNPINITGSTDPEVKVIVNSFWAIVDENNNFSYKLQLLNGENNIKVIATDQAGNKTEKNIKVKYSQ